MRNHRWPNVESDDSGATWAGTSAAVVGALVRWLIVLLVQHFGG